MDTGRHGSFSLFHQQTLHASDIGHNRAFFQAGRPLRQMPVIRADRRGQHNQVGIPHSVFGVDDVTVDRAQLDRSFQVFDTPPNPMTLAANPFDGESCRVIRRSARLR